MTRDIIRRCRFTPYLKGQGPTFALTLWDTGKRDWRAHNKLGYRLTMNNEGKRSVLFKGDDFSPSPLHAIDSDEVVRSLMAFLTLKPGDTDKEYFEGYSAAQLEFRSLHSEALESEILVRFGEG